MDQEMFTLYPSGILVFLVDDDSRFLRTASMLLSLLNFKVSTCSSPSSALKMLSAADKFKDVDVVLVDAKKVTTCGFDFKAIVEPDLRIPVLHFLSQNHRSAGAEADALLRTLDLASFILKKPFDGDDICNLWRDIAWRKCCLNGSRTGGGAAGDVGQGNSGGGGNGLPPPWAGSYAIDDDGEEEERVHFREIRGVRGRKRKGAGKNHGSPSGSSVPPVPARRRGRPVKNMEQMDIAEHKMDHVAKPVPPTRSKKAKKNGENASMPVIPEAMDDDVEPQPPQPKQSLFVQSVLQTLDVPPYNPNIFADAVERGSNVFSFSFSGSGNTAAVAPAPTAPAPPPAYQAPTAPAPPPVYQAPPAPAPAVVSPAPALPVVHQQQQTPLAGNVVGNISPAAAATNMSTSVTHKEATLPHLRLGGFGPFPYQGPLPSPAVQQDMFAPPRNFTTMNIQLPFQQPPTIPAGDLFTGAVRSDDIIEAADVDDATHEAGGDYGNTASTLMQSLQLGGAAQEEDDDVAGMMEMYNATADRQLMAPQQVDDVAEMYYYDNDDNAAMFYNDNNDNAAMFYNDNNGEAFVAEPHDQGLGMAYGVNDPAMADDAFDGNAAAFMSPNVMDQLAIEDDLGAMVGSVGNDEDYSFPLEALMGADDMQMFDAGRASQQGGATEGAAQVDAAGMYLNGGEEGMENWGVGPADGIAMLDDMLMNTAGSDLFPHYMNNGCE